MAHADYVINLLIRKRLGLCFLKENIVTQLIILLVIASFYCQGHTVVTVATAATQITNIADFDCQLHGTFSIGSRLQYITGGGGCFQYAGGSTLGIRAHVPQACTLTRHAHCFFFPATTTHVMTFVVQHGLSKLGQLRIGPNLLYGLSGELPNTTT